MIGPDPDPLQPSAVPAKAADCVPVWLLALLIVASAGLALPVWLYRQLRRLDAGAPRLQHLGWALAALIPVFSLPVLVEVQRLLRQATADVTQPPPSKRVAWGMALVTAVLVFTPLRHVPVVYLAPALFFVFVQDEINMCHLLRGREPAARLLWLAPALVSAAFASWGLWYLSRPDLLFVFSHDSHDFEDVSKGVRLTPPPDWVRAAPGTFGDRSSSLEFARRDRSASLVVYAHPTDDVDLADVLLQRLGWMEENHEIKSRIEDRMFVGRYDDQIFSRAIYETADATDPELFVIGTIETDDWVYEMVAHSRAPNLDRVVLMQAVHNLGFKDQGRR